MSLNDVQTMIIEQLVLLLTFVSIFVAIVLAFLILYANNFLIKRRKKELGLYTLLGMPKGKISRILVYETLVIGFISLVSGMIAGLLLSQVMTAVTANLFAVPLDYSFVFSPSATFITLLAFSFIFLITMLFNTVILNRYKLIDLLNADRKNDNLKIKNIFVSVILFILSLIFLGGAYYVTFYHGMAAFSYLGPIILAGSIGTLLFFLSLAGFLLTIIKSSKRIYFKNLNCFVLRQIHSNINTNFISMSIVCIMLLLSIGALSTGLSLNSTFNASIANTTPYDFTYQLNYTWPNGAQQTPNDIDLRQEIEKLNIDQSLISSQEYIKSYVADTKMDDPAFVSAISDNEIKQNLKNLHDNYIMVTPLSTFNKVRGIRGLEPITLSSNGLYLYSTTAMISDSIQKILDATPEVTLFGKQMKVENDSYQELPLGTTNAVNQNVIAFVVDDRNIPSDTPIYSAFWNVNLADKITSSKFEAYVDERITNEEHNPDVFTLPYNNFGSSKDTVFEMNKGLSVTFTYIGIYLGAVFLIASAVILALQQLSQANDNKRRYIILSKIGTEKRMMNHSILLQISIYFLLPLLLAIVHSYVGIHMVNTLVVGFGRSDIMLSSIITAGIILGVYGSYFLVTYMGYKNIVKN